MSRRLFDFTIKEWQGSFPKEGTSHYIFSATVDKGGNSGTIKKIQREFTVFCISNEDNGFSRTVVVKTIDSDIKLNVESSSSTILLNKLFSVYDRISLKVKFDGTILKIDNYLQIQRSWKKVKDEILENYKGSNIRRFIRSVDNRLETEQKIISDISSFENFGLLFHPIYGKYDSISHASKEFKFVGIKTVHSIQEHIKVSEVNDTNVVLTIEKDRKSANHLSYLGSYQINSTNQWIEKGSVKIKEIYNDLEYLSEFYVQQKV